MPFTLLTEVVEAAPGSWDTEVQALYGYGASVSVSGDYAVVGSSLEASSTGRVYVYRRVEGGWEEHQTLVSPTPAEGDSFGCIVDISGSWIAVRGIHNSQSGMNSLHLFTLSSDGQWEYSTTMAYGWHFSLEGDVLVTTSVPDGSDNLLANVYRLSASGLSWQWEATLAPSMAGTLSHFYVHTDGASVALGSVPASCGGRDSNSAAEDADVEVCISSETSPESCLENDSDKYTCPGDILVYTYAESSGAWVLDPFSPMDLYYRGVPVVSGDTLAVSTGTKMVDAGFGKSVTVFRSDPSAYAWEMEAELIGDLAWEYGASLAMQGDTLVVGDPATEGYAGATYIYQRTDGVWGLLSKLVGQQYEQASGYSLALDGQSIVVGSGLTSGVVAMLDSSWPVNKGLEPEIRVEAGSPRVEVVLSDDYGSTGSASGTYETEEYGTHTMEATESGGMLSTSEWLYPGQMVTVSPSGLTIESSYYSMADITVNARAEAVPSVPRILTADDLSLSFMSTRDIAGVQLEGVYTVGTRVDVQLGTDAVSLNTSVAEYDEWGYVALLDSIYAVPDTWQVGAEGGSLAVPISLLDNEGVILESGVGWVAGSDTSATPVRGSIVDTDFASILSSGDCVDLDIALYDAEDNPVSCGTPGITFLTTGDDVDPEASQQHFVFPLSPTAEYCTMHVCVPESARIKTLLGLAYGGSTILAFPVVVATTAVRYIAIVSVVMFLSSVALALWVGSKTHALTHVPSVLRPGVDGDTRSIAAKAGKATVAAIDIAIFAVLKVLSLAGNFYIVLQFCGYFGDVVIAEQLLTKYPVIKWAFRLTQLMDSMVSSFIMWAVGKDIPPWFFCLWYLFGTAFIVAVTYANWFIGYIQDFLPLSSRAVVYPLFFILNNALDVMATIIADVSLWFIITGKGTGKSFSIVFFALVSMLTYLALAFVGDESSIVWDFAKGSFKCMRTYREEVFERWSAKHSGPSKWQKVLRSTAAKGLWYAFLWPCHMCYVLVSPVTHSLPYLLQCVCGVYAPLSKEVNRLCHIVLSVVVVTAMYSGGHSLCPGPVRVVALAFAASVWLTEAYDVKDSFDPYSGTMSHVISVNSRLRDDSIDAAKKDETEGERWVELSLTMRSSAFLVVPIVGPMLGVATEFLCSPALRFPGVRTSAINWVGNLLALVCVILMVLMSGSETAMDIAVGVYVATQVLDVAQEGRVIAEYARWSPFSRDKGVAKDKRSPVKGMGALTSTRHVVPV
ncbi:hypothetical protein KIPB_007626 [Kipferlia bialata]|uniref:Uncharacterized protein n=1 Tax=Kipferlia bialata TaxID=797122 RepID=A0A9K3D0K4_9EUKA|nr:hypothetical protein KIPB_007626 [Kipferlia bialata]|eukprot:g7626.t1